MENDIFSSEIGSAFEEQGGTHPPRIPRSTDLWAKPPYLVCETVPRGFFFFFLPSSLLRILYENEYVTQCKHEIPSLYLNNRGVKIKYIYCIYLSFKAHRQSFESSAFCVFELIIPVLENFHFKYVLYKEKFKLTVVFF